MKNIPCDIFLVGPLRGDSVLLRQLRIFQSGFSPDPNKEYSGYLGLNIGRLKGVAIVTHFRSNGVTAFNIPVKYRDLPRVPLSQILDQSQSEQLVEDRRTLSQNPMFYILRSEKPGSLDEGGGLITMDALDGHRWSGEELDEYMYDFNNLI
ncbi:hypothetical protein PV762_25925 [Mitsuaria sp. CC2]|uniref:hypothetical protein n=1 Tax=Mitsuaria sp. CC2 TaxID=3029186 RepID=UPI003B8DB68D